MAFDVDTGQWVAQAEEAYVLGSGVEPDDAHEAEAAAGLMRGEVLTLSR